jgi:hypothetical protein
MAIVPACQPKPGKIPFPFALDHMEIKYSQASIKNYSDRRTVYSVEVGDVSGEITVIPSDATNATKMRDMQVSGVRSAFKVMPAPYAGHITTHIDCGTEQYISEKTYTFQETQTQIIFAVSGARKVLGTCAVSEVRFAMALWLFFDKERQLLVIAKLFKPVASPTEIQQSQSAIMELIQQFRSPPYG